MAYRLGRNDPIYRALRLQVMREEPLCWLCGKPWHPDAPPRTRYSYTLDHVVPLEHGGHPHARENAHAAHYGCNSAKRDRWVTPPPRTTSRDW